MVYSIIHKIKLEGAHRLDAEYYQPEYLKVANALERIKIVRLGDFSFITDGQHGYFQLDENSEIRQITAQHIIDGFIDKTESDRLSKVTHERNLRASLQEHDVVLSTVGTVGNAGIVTKEIPPANLDQNVARIHLKGKVIDPWYLAAFLNSAYGQIQIFRNITGQVQQRLSLGTVRDLMVPMLGNQDNIRNLLEKSYKTLVLSKDFYVQAEDLLLEELGLKSFEIKDDFSFVVNLSDVKSANRIDSDFFQPKYEALISHFKRSAEPLKNIASRSTAVVKIDLEAEYKYIEISDINTANGDITANIVMGRDLPANAKMKLNGGELLISKVRPTRRAVAIVPDSWSNNYVASGAFSIFNINSPMKEYIQVVMRSIIGKLQLEKPTTGTSYPTITDEDVENILIPVLPKPTQQKIADLVKKSHEARKKSKELLEEAKRKVEEMIEKKSSN